MSNTSINTSNPVYASLVETLRDEIHAGRSQPNQLIGSEHEMVRRTGLSRVSVRRAIDQLVDEGLVERRPGKGVFVRDRHVATRLVEIVVPDMTREPWVRIVRSAQRSGADRGIQIQLHDAHQYGDLDVTLRVLERLPELAPSGAILGSICHPRFAELIVKLKGQAYPFVLIGESWREIEVPTVSADNRAGGYTVGQELVRRGHRRIGYIGPMVDPTARRRFEGLRDAVNDGGVAFDRALVGDLVLENPLVSWERAVDQAIRRMMDQPDRPTAILCCTDGAAADACRTLKRMGVAIPSDISVIGYDDEPICRYLDPPLASVRQPVEQMGQAAMEMLIGRMGNPRGAIEHCVLPVEFVSRASLADRLADAGGTPV
ncbi:MAG: GntR family transcriptional regulator [Phycisphaerae bacterium]|nr:GntR family transcriptional regulator [Phycisphaerae bacterium]